MKWCCENSVTDCFSNHTFHTLCCDLSRSKISMDGKQLDNYCAEEFEISGCVEESASPRFHFPLTLTELQDSASLAQAPVKFKTWYLTSYGLGLSTFGWPFRSPIGSAFSISCE